MKIFLIILFILSTFNFAFAQEVDNSNSKAYQGAYFMIGHGFGRTYGGAGTRLQFRYGDKQGVGVHVGHGFWFDGDMTTVYGLKFFPYKNLYLNVAYGSYGTEGGYGSPYISAYTTHAATLSIGGDFVWGRTIANGINFAIGLTKVADGEYKGEIEPSFDLAYIIRFAIKSSK